jgi:hypothetical protein
MHIGTTSSLKCAVVHFLPVVDAKKVLYVPKLPEAVVFARRVLLLLLPLKVELVFPTRVFITASARPRPSLAAATQIDAVANQVKGNAAKHERANAYSWQKWIAGSFFRYRAHRVRLRRVYTCGRPTPFSLKRKAIRVISMR